ncbi:hypothetical protein [Algibacillus agarilyticus]|uniref:hypothetical protein n=1 Tax=Algibacillus agarilyticus TaxID=2234133 RepID=UPI000DCFE75E|nr:hypothetical protein [Algibacillus agarilyticus]
MFVFKVEKGTAAYKVELSMIMLLIMLSLIGCTDSVDEYAPRTTLIKVDKLLAPYFVSGEWRYRGARPTDQGIAAYIQVPDRIELSEKQHKNYILLTVCPDKTVAYFWHDIFPYELYIRTYNYVDRNYIETHCPSPLMQDN